MNENVTLFGRLQKIDDTDDGSLRVEGIASSEAIDSQGEIVTAEAMRAALPDFFKHGTGALREMHQMSAAGSVLEAEIDKQGRTRIVAKVVDPVAIRKVRAGVYVGFSIGGKTLARDSMNRKRIVKIRWDEVSLVDRPSNSEATISLWKAAGAPTIADALANMSAEDRALILTKAALAVPISTARWGF